MTSTTSSTTTVKSQPKFKSSIEAIFNITLMVIALIAIVLVLEGAAYFWEKSQAEGIYAWELVASRRMKWVPYTEPGVGFTLIEPESSYAWQGIPVKINLHGLRGPETTFKKPDKTIRILNLGDSVAMGWGVRFEDTYGQQLEYALNQSSIDQQTFEIVNAGVPGWNLENELAYFQAQGYLYEPDLVLLEITLANDIRGQNALTRVKPTGTIEWLRAHTFTLSFLEIQSLRLQAYVAGEDRISFINPPREAGKYFPTDADDGRWSKIWEVIETIKKEAERHDARFALILFPLEYQVLDVDYSTTAQEFLTAKAAESGIPVVDLLPAFRKACQEKSGGPCQLEDRYLFADVWMHPSALGHQITAGELAETIREQMTHIQGK